MWIGRRLRGQGHHSKIHARHSHVVVTFTDVGWTTRPDGTSQGGQLVFTANSELLQGRESNMSLISWHLSRLKRVARSSSAAETQTAADGDDEAVYIRLCLKEVLFGQLDLRNWQSEARQIPAALVVDLRGVHDALARSSSCLGLKDKKSGLEALALKQSLVECETIIRWCHSACTQLGDVVTKFKRLRCSTCTLGTVCSSWFSLEINTRFQV